MMLEICSGNLLEANAEVLVNPVNCVSVMGKGLALQFKPQHVKQAWQPLHKQQWFLTAEHA